jgi:hypothetical protein
MSVDSATPVRSIGHPGKHGTLDQLLDRMFVDVPADVRAQLMKNLDVRVFGPQCFTDVTRNFKTVDIDLIQKIRTYLDRARESAYSENGSSYQVRPGLPVGGPAG